MARVVPIVDYDSQPRQPCRSSTLAQVAAAYRESQPLAQLGDSAHAGPADADEVQSPLPLEQSEIKSLTHAARRSVDAIWKQTCAIFFAASGIAAECALAPISVNTPGFAAISSNARARFSPNA